MRLKKMLEVRPGRARVQASVFSCIYCTGLGHSGPTSVGASWAGTDDFCMKNMDCCEYAYRPAVSTPVCATVRGNGR